MADLETLTDTQLDTALARQFDDRRRALSCGDTDEALACKVAAAEIVAEMDRRLDEWIAGQMETAR